jgi:hypothetical protein
MQRLSNGPFSIRFPRFAGTSDEPLFLPVSPAKILLGWIFKTGYRIKN